MAIKIGNKYLANIPDAVSYLLNKKVKATSIEVNPDNEAEYRLVITFEDDSTIESEYVAVEPNLGDIKANLEDVGKYLAVKIVDGTPRIIARSVLVSALQANAADEGKVLTVQNDGTIAPEEVSGGGTVIYQHIIEFANNTIIAYDLDPQKITSLDLYDRMRRFLAIFKPGTGKILMLYDEDGDNNWAAETQDNFYKDTYEASLGAFVDDNVSPL